MIKEKDEEITNLRAQVKNLQAKLQEVHDVKIQFLTKIPTRKPSEQLEANANIINVVEVKEISSQSFKCENCGTGVGFKGKILGHKCQRQDIKNHINGNYMLMNNNLPRMKSLRYTVVRNVSKSLKQSQN